tara:strand:+ start:1117 stop:1380 length:264 start_codon:yes stop_codon:yes gene_type:complete
MSNKENNKKVDKLEDTQDLDYLARFACLMYGVNVAADFAEKRGINTEKNNSWIKPIVFQKYIDERYEDMKFNIKQSLEGKENEIHSW